MTNDGVLKNSNICRLEKKAVNGIYLWWEENQESAVSRKLKMEHKTGLPIPPELYMLQLQLPRKKLAQLSLPLVQNTGERIPWS